MINFAGMKKYIFYILSGTLLLLLVSGCKKDPVEDPGEDPVVVPAETIATNQWIYDNMSQYYFWNTQLPTGIDNTKEIDPEAYFYKLVYKTKDYWSYITDDYASLASEFNGDPVTMGYYPAFYLVGSNNVMIVVCYVYPGSPAAEAGLERGDFILSIDNTLLDTTNYYTAIFRAKIYCSAGRNHKQYTWFYRRVA